MNPVSTVVLLLTAVTILAFAARRLPIPYPTLMVFAGAILGWLPGLPHIELESDTILLIFLPLLLYAAAWQMSWHDFRAELRPISLLAVGLVVATTVLVAVLTHAFVPGIPWSLAFALGALVAPPDAVAATAVTRHVPLPRRLITILEGESLVNDAAGLVLYRVAVAAAVTGIFSPASAVAQLILAPAGGVAIGLAIGWAVVRLHRRLEDPTIESVITLLTPFAVYLLAESVETSGVLATVAAGMSVSRSASTIFSPPTRLHATAVWNVVVFLLNGLAFILIGLQIPDAVAAVSQRPMYEVVGLALLVCLAVIAVRLIWVFPAAYLPRLFIKRIRQRDPLPPTGVLLVLGWAGMRGVVTVAAALALPYTTSSGAPLPDRDILVLVAFAVVLATLVVQGQTLAPLIRWLHVAPESDEDAVAENEARRVILAATLVYLDETAAEQGDSDGAIRHLRERFERILASTVSVVGSTQPRPEARSLGQLQLEVIAHQRSKLADLGRQSVVSLEVCRRIERLFDLEEARIRELLSMTPSHGA